jgi:hypothetical protein
LSVAEALAFSEAEGSEWILRHLPVIEDELKPLAFRFRRWNDWLANPDVKTLIREIENTYHSNSLLRGKISEDVQSFLRRRAPDFVPTAEELRELHQHQIEELAVYAYQALDPMCINVYNGSESAMLREARRLDDSILPTSLTRRQYVFLDVRLQSDNKVGRIPSR